MRKSVIIIIVLQLAACGAGNEKQRDNHEVHDNKKEVVCFIYHRFGDSRYSSTNISRKDFEAHLTWLKAHDFQVLSLSDAIDYLKSNKEYRKTAVITVDDGFASFYKNALPLLKKFGFPATLFVNTETVGGNDYMGWNEIKEAQKYGIEIGNHTHSHAWFLNQPEDERYIAFENEVTLAQQLLKENTGTMPTVFAYPYGELDTKMREVIEKLGFKAAAAQNSGVIYAGTNLMQCPRFPMSEAYAGLDQFAGKAEMKALRVNRVNPGSFLLPEGKTKPTLQLKFDGTDLRLDQLQCFIQGNECEMEQMQSENGLVTLIVSPVKSIAHRRRTLYTITVPDSQGQWHWFSHLWINPDEK